MKPAFSLFLTFLFVYQLSAQTLIGEYKLKDYSVDDEIYPYGWVEFGGDVYGLANRPAIRLSENDFVYLWKPSFGAKKRMLSCFNLLTDLQWETEFELSRNEEVFHLYSFGDSIFTLSYHFRQEDKHHIITGKVFEKNEGKFVREKIVYIYQGKENDLIGFDISGDSSKTIIFHFEHESGNKRPRNLLNYPFSDGQLGFRVTNATHIRYSHLTPDLETVAEGSMAINASQKEKSSIIDCQISNDGSIITTLFQEPSTLKTIRHDPNENTQEFLEYNGFTDPFKDAPYAAHLPVSLGESGKIYAAHADRERLKGKWYTRGFQVVTFDFKNDSIDLSRRVRISSGLQVQVSKSREAASLRPVTEFDQYLLKEIVEMPDESVLLLTQKYESYSVRSHLNPSGPVYSFQSLAEEILLFEFNPGGDPQKVIIIPLRQRASSLLEKTSRFFSHYINKKQKEMQLITWEDDGEKLRQPPKIFYRKVDLESGTYSDRQQLYEGKRRNQFYLRAYTLFLNPTVAILMVVDGDAEKHPQVVSVKLGE